MLFHSLLRLNIVAYIYDFTTANHAFCFWQILAQIYATGPDAKIIF